MMQRPRPVDVIALCSASGELRPLRLQGEDQEQGVFRMDIDRVLRVTEISHVGVESKIFLCRASAGERSWMIELKYLLRSQTWRLLRRID